MESKLVAGIYNTLEMFMLKEPLTSDKISYHLNQTQGKEIFHRQIHRNQYLPLIFIINQHFASSKEFTEIP